MAPEAKAKVRAYRGGCQGDTDHAEPIEQLRQHGVLSPFQTGYGLPSRSAGSTVRMLDTVGTQERAVHVPQASSMPVEAVAQEAKQNDAMQGENAIRATNS